MTQSDKVWKHLNKYGTITSLEMFTNYYICCPHAIIRYLRKIYGNDSIKDTWIQKTRKEYNAKGKEETVTVRYKKYFLDKVGV